MRHEVKKITKIIDEIMTYCLFNYEAMLADLSVKRDEDAWTLGFTFSGVAVSPEQLSELKKKLKNKRNHELEDYYWQLTGEIEDSNELELVAMMSDEVTITYENSKLAVHLIRKL